MTTVEPDTSALEQEITRLRRILNSLPAMVAYWDADQRCRFANQDYQRWFGVTPQCLIGRHMRELLGPIYEKNLPYIEGALQGEPQFFEREIPDPNGGPSRHSQANYIPDVVDGVVRGFSVLVADISARKRMEEELRQLSRKLESLALHDSLTGLPNRLVLVDRMGRAMALNARHERHGAILFIDLDDFKPVNDTHGHAAGDALLCDVSRRLSSAVRRSHTVARVDGDEFIILLPDLVDRAAAGEAAQHVMAMMTDEPFVIRGFRLTVRWCIGIATFPEDGMTSAELLAKADAALYDAKRSGRNRVANWAKESGAAVAAPVEPLTHFTA